MRELESIIAAFDQNTSQGVQCALATVVHVEGSSYRKAGARMLVDEYGQMTGAISGGCLEGDALRKALHAMHLQENKLVTYDTSDENDAIIGAQLGCNGIIQVLFEPIDPVDSQNPIELLREAVGSKSHKAIVTLFNLNKRLDQKGTCLIFDENSTSNQNIGDIALFAQLQSESKKVLSNRFPHFGEYQKGAEKCHAFIELYSPPPKLVLVGAGNDAQVLASMAGMLGWEVVVTDGRPTHANSARFVSSCQVLVSRSEEFMEKVEIDSRTVVVLISHNYNYDLAVFKLLLGFPEIPYVGILGPKKKYLRMLDDLEAAGLKPSPAQKAAIHAPVGLNIGAETPAEIALSILAEIQAVVTNTNAQPLREKEGAIHDKRYSGFKVTSL